MSARRAISGLAVSLALAACGEPRLTIEFSIADAELAALVHNVTIEVYRPAEVPYDCDDLAFGRVQPVPIVRAELTGDNAPDLGEVPRTGSKLFVLRGHREAGTVKGVVAGCARVEVIAGEQRLTVAAEPVTIVTVEGGSYGLTSDRSVEFNRWRAQVNNAVDTPLVGVEVRWEAFGAGMTAPVTGSVKTEPQADLGDSARAVFSLAQHPAPGPIEVTVRSRWGRRSAAAVAFVPPREHRVSLLGAGADFEAIGAGAGLSRLLVAVRKEFPQAPRANASDTQVSQHRLGDEGGLASSVVATLPSTWILGQRGGAPLLLTSDRRRTVSINDGELVLGPEERFDLGVVAAPQRLIDLGPCGPGSGELGSRTLIDFGASGYGLYDERFVIQPLDVLTQAGLDQPGGIISSGCITSGEGGVLRGLATVAELGLLAMIAPDGNLQPGSLPSSFVSLGFGGQHTAVPPVALSTTIVGRETMVALHPMIVGGTLLGEPSYPLPSVPLALDAGDVDGDGTTDIVAVTRVDSRRVALYAVVGQEQRTASAGIVLPGTFNEPWLGVVELDGQAPAEIVVGDRRPLSDGEHWLLVHRMNERHKAP